MRKNDSSESLSSSSGAPSLVEGSDGTKEEEGEEEEEEDEEEVLFDETEAIGYGRIRVNGERYVEDTPVNEHTERTPLLGSHLPSPKKSHLLYWRTLSLSLSMRKFFGPESVPLLLFLSDLVISMSSGMTLRYARVCASDVLVMCTCDCENTHLSVFFGDN